MEIKREQSFPDIPPFDCINCSECGKVMVELFGTEGMCEKCEDRLEELFWFWDQPRRLTNPCLVYEWSTQ
jgi:hypothetical protein